jgi:hypothetical protein
MATKTIYLLNIDDYAPEITALTYPTIVAYAQRIEADIEIITERKFEKWPITYEKLQIHDLAKARKSDWVFYIDSDTLVHPELPDITELMTMDTVAHNAVDFAPLRWRYDDYFRRDGRYIGSANWFALASSWCLDLWRPLDDLTPEEAISNITCTMPEKKIGMKSEHLVDDYALSRNIARFGLKVITLNELWRRANLSMAEFFFHQYLMPIEDYEGMGEDKELTMLPGKVSSMKTILERWGI